MKKGVVPGVVIVLSVLVCEGAEEPSRVKFGGYLDSDVWTDFARNIYIDDELDLSMAIGFSEKVRASLRATIVSGMIASSSFTRGIQYSLAGSVVGQKVLMGSADRDGLSGLLGSTTLSLGEALELGVYYGV